MSSNSSRARVLIVDDEAVQMKALCDTLRDEGYETLGFTSAKAALTALREQEFDIVMTDLMMPDIDGIAFLRAGQEIDRNLVGIVMTGHGAIETAVQAMQAGALDYIQKPFKLRNILPVLARALTVRRLRTENIQLRQAVTIHELSAAFTRELDATAIVGKVADAAFQQSNDGGAAIFVVAPGTSELTIEAARGQDLPRLIGRKIVATDQLKSWLSKTRRTLMDLSDWVSADFNFDFQSPDLKFATCIPMLAAGDFIGLLCFNPGAPTNTTSLGQLKALSILANTAAAAIQGAHLLDRLRQANEELEQRVHQRTVELEATNKELEAFSYTISHDLRAPLRTITGYTDMLLQDYRRQLTEDGQHALDALRSAGCRMGELINDLLKLSHLSQQDLRVGPIATAQLVQQVLGELHAQHPDRQIRVEIAELPDCRGDESLLKQVFVNLLSNAFKFTQQCTQAHIEMGARKEANELIYFVRDNGAGFDMQQADKLFGVFHRLHSSAEFEGTGIGLSIVQRIVNRHGGRAWAEGKVGGGATFYFSLPNLSDSVAMNTSRKK